MITELEKIIAAYGMFEEDAVTKECCEEKKSEIESPVKAKDEFQLKEE